ncbi:MAG: hypothetical protein H7Y36_05535 [Armatimonadetes bacterium]|nr:hypothetical protein [Akkermansiaceae bacterium]
MDESKVYLQKGGSGEWAEASLFDPITAEYLKLWDKEGPDAMRILSAGIRHPYHS